MKIINIDKITEKEINSIFNTVRLNEMFYKVKAFANMEIGLYDIQKYMERKGFGFSKNIQGKGSVSFFITDKMGGKYTLKY